jgi:GDPmannose 4,6-dehydratase
MDEVKPHEVYNLGAQSHVRVSFDMPIYTAETVAMGALQAARGGARLPGAFGQQVRYYQASSSEQYGKVVETRRRRRRRSTRARPYACAKVMAHWATVNYRESYGMHASCGILFNHESPRRGETFVTRKITRAVGRIKMGLQDKVFLGNLDSKRDWGFAGDYVKMMWMMLQQDEPDDYVIATNRTITVREFADMAFKHAGLNFEDHVEFDPRYLRPAEVDLLLGDPAKAKEKLGWEPETSVEELAAMMVDSRHRARVAARRRSRTRGTRCPSSWGTISKAQRFPDHARGPDQQGVHPRDRVPPRRRPRRHGPAARRGEHALRRVGGRVRRRPVDPRPVSVL